MLVGFAGLTVGAALAALYLWQERRLKRHQAAILRLGAPALVTLDVLSARTIAVALPLLTLGIATGLVQLVSDRAAVDAVMVVTLATWAIYAVFLALRHTSGWRGRRGAYLATAGVMPVLAVHFGVALTHFG